MVTLWFQIHPRFIHQNLKAKHKAPAKSRLLNTVVVWDELQVQNDKTDNIIDKKLKLLKKYLKENWSCSHHSLNTNSGSLLCYFFLLNMW